MICEGKTDAIYIKCAIRNLPQFHPQLGAVVDSRLKSTISFFNYESRASHFLELRGGTGDLKPFILEYADTIAPIKHRPMPHPIIVLIDNDSGANGLFAAIKGVYKLSIDHANDAAFFHLVHNLYLVKTPTLSETPQSYIESFFDPEVLGTKLNGKSFNLHKAHANDSEFGKLAFATKVIKPNERRINFSRFAPLLTRIVAVLNDYKETGSAQPEL